MHFDSSKPISKCLGNVLILKTVEGKSYDWTMGIFKDKGLPYLRKAPFYASYLGVGRLIDFLKALPLIALGHGFELWN